ncbi:hypothetical protein EEL31_21505 [Brevibacillus laterosporus]|uniref:Uncharacterized protein n=1 Tax=Brevibacillus laterosporus TaxID=1465 RepID=A0A518V258_BRELA|nr:hypothetical protein [Brevibacillus laterosporus]QDX91082.1 hypothetical protein EEL30_00970 [Brevibacillus laterosporus]TPG70764.1 hypothetical protein EEL31_21505 [Brevibacillus laterosporus]
MIKHQLFFHLRLKENEVFTEQLGLTVNELKETMSMHSIEVHQVVPLENNEYTLILNCFFEDRTH